MDAEDDDMAMEPSSTILERQLFFELVKFLTFAGVDLYTYYYFEMALIHCRPSRSSVAISSYCHVISPPRPV